MEASSIDSLHTCLSKFCLSVVPGSKCVKKSLLLKLSILLKNIFFTYKRKNISHYISLNNRFCVQVEIKPKNGWKASSLSSSIW